jgi:hypothetical protein
MKDKNVFMKGFLWINKTQRTNDEYNILTKLLEQKTHLNVSLSK